MADVYDRWHLSRPKKDAKPCTEHSSRTRMLVASAEHGAGKRWQVRYRDHDGKQCKENFEKRSQADARAAEVETDLNRGTYIDPKAGKVTLREFAEDWLAARTSDPSTIAVQARHLRLHILPVLGSRPLRALRPSTVQAWLSGLVATGMQPTYANGILGTLSSILGAAVDDEAISKNPCRAASVKPPKVVKAKIVPWTVERVTAVLAALPGRYTCMGILAAGCGLRQGEILGIGPDDIDFLRGVVHVRRQVKHVDYKRVFALPKGKKVREVPLPPKVAAALAAHMKAYPAVRVVLPWATLDGEPTPVSLFFTTVESANALDSNSFNSRIWKPVLAKAGVIPTPKKGERYAAADEDGMHALRHHFASVLLDGGETITALSEYLGHHDPAFTLRTYAHMMPTSEGRTKRVIDAALGASIDALISGPSAPDVPSLALST
ncbi:site-specific recombinase XerD [Streptomyces sp. 846.5]|nr:site-specific integrase [Streptomyces sp. 846.5]TDT95342.1 site-specific recombinase XerD [Streptomyces sp. 846.5]